MTKGHKYVDTSRKGNLESTEYWKKLCSVFLVSTWVSPRFEIPSNNLISKTPDPLR